MILIIVEAENDQKLEQKQKMLQQFVTQITILFNKKV